MKSMEVREETQVAEPFNTRKVVNTLEDLMHRVTKDECTPATVMAACNCASRIIDFARVHIELERMADKRAEHGRLSRQKGQGE